MAAELLKTFNLEWRDALLRNVALSQFDLKIQFVIGIQYRLYVVHKDTAI